MKNRKISISSCFNYAIPLAEQIPLVSRTGFSHLSIGSQYDHSGILETSKLKELAKQLAEHHIQVNTLHGVNLDKPDALQTTRKLTKAAQFLNIPVMVVHCSAFTFNPNQYDERYKTVISHIVELEKISKESGIKFALENVLPGVATQMVENVVANANPEYIGFCYDSSHDQISGPKPFSLLERLKDRLMAVHLSDRIKEFVDHVIPGEGFIDFSELSRIIRESSFKRPLLIEIMVANSKHKHIPTFLDMAYKRACEIYDTTYD